MDAWVMPTFGALLGFLVLFMLLSLCVIVSTFARWVHDRRIIRGKLDRQMRQRLKDFASREVEV